MSLSRAVSGLAPSRFGIKLSWRTASLIGLPLGVAGIAFIIYYIEKRRKVKDDSDPIPETPLEAALALKLRGNKYFKGGQYTQAISLYDEGLEKCPLDAVQERAAFYQNRAAAKENQRQYEAAVADCTAALTLSPKYLKALNRRAHLYEKLEKWEECLLDVTACCIFEKFKNPENILCMDQVLKKIGQQKSQEERNKLSYELPSSAFLRNYLSAFAWDPFLDSPPEKTPRHFIPENTNGTDDTKSSIDMPSVKNSNVTSRTDVSYKQSYIDVSQLNEPAQSAFKNLELALEYLANGQYDLSMEYVTKSVDFFEKAFSNSDVGKLLKFTDGDKHVLTSILADDSLSNPVSESITNGVVEECGLKNPTVSGEQVNAESFLADMKLAHSKASLLRATYMALSGQPEEAKKILQIIGADDSGASTIVRVNALIKCACLSMSVDQDVAACLYEFQRAQSVCPECPDVYLHRGQINLLADQLDEALHDLNTAVKLKPEFSVAQAQRLFTLYRRALRSSDASQVNSRVDEFRRLVKKYPTCSEAHSLFAQILAERGDFEESDKEFAEVLSLAPDSGLAYAHRGILQLRWKQDRDAAFKWFTEGAKADPKCELIYELLGQLAVEKGEFPKALRHFDSAIRLAKTQNDLIHLISLREGVNAQLKVCEQYDISIPEVVSNIQREQQQFVMAMQS